jgi:hypothetical protein
MHDDQRRLVLVEIEWVTTNFERHRHDIKVLIDADGFFVILRADASFLVEQIEIDRTNFLDWVERHARELAAEILTDIDRQAPRNKELHGMRLPYSARDELR